MTTYHIRVLPQTETFPGGWQAFRPWQKYEMSTLMLSPWTSPPPPQPENVITFVDWGFIITNCNLCAWDENLHAFIVDTINARSRKRSRSVDDVDRIGKEMRHMDLL